MAGTAPRQKDSPTGAGISGENTPRDIKPAFLQPFYHRFLGSMPPLAPAEPQPARTPETGRRHGPCPPGSVPEEQQPGTNIDTSADPSSARMPTYIDTNAEPVLSLLYLFIFFSSLLSISGVTPRGPIPQSDRSPPFFRDFRPLIPAHGDRRLHGRLDGQSPAVGLQNLHRPRTFSSPCRHRSVSSLGGRARRVVQEPGVN